MADVLIIMHAKAALDGDLRQAVAAARQQGNSVDVRVTWEAGDAQLFATAAARTGRYDTLIAAGGDGTMNAVVAGMMDPAVSAPPALGILPAGTANDFARACSIPANDTLAALNIALASTSEPVDVGMVNGRAFLNLATGGFGTEVTATTPEDLKRILGSVAYLVTGIKQATNLVTNKAIIRGDGFFWEGSFLAFAVGNGRFAGGGIPMCPDALINDELLDLSILPDVTSEELPRVMADMLVRGMGARETALVQARVSELTVSSEQLLQINLDGEPLQGRSFHFELRPAALRLRLPPDASVLTD